MATSPRRDEASGLGIIPPRFNLKLHAHYLLPPIQQDLRHHPIKTRPWVQKGVLDLRIYTGEDLAENLCEGELKWREETYKGLLPG